MTGETLNYNLQLTLHIGQYCQVHEEFTPRNSQLPRTQGAICLGPSGNIQGGFKFMSLATGKVLSRRTWDNILIPNSVITRVNQLGKDQPEQFIFTDRKGCTIGDVETITLDDKYDLNYDDPVEIPGEDRGEIEIETPTTANENENENEHPVIDHDKGIEVGIVPDDNQEVDPQPPLLPETAPDASAVATATAKIEPTAPDEIPGVRRSNRVKFQTKQAYIPSLSGSSKYAFAVTQLETQGVLHPDAHMFFQMNMYRCEPDVVAAIMTQLSLKAGLKTWGKEAKKAVHKEMQQLHFRDTFKPMHWNELNHAQKQSILESHMFLKEKRTGEIKGRTVAGGNKQREFLSKEEVSSPTVATESVLLTCIIEADEGRDVATIDIPNAFIQTRIDDEKDMAIIKIRGLLVDMLVDIAPDVYKPYVTTDKKGVKQLIVQCLNAIYGTMMAGLMYYTKFCKSLLSVGFIFNPYDPCVANKLVGGKQMTICFHVDDCKVSHISSKMVTKMVAWLRQEYESIFEDGTGKMTVNRGKVHTYLGMRLDYSSPGRVMISQFEYIAEVILAFDKADPGGSGTKTSAAPTNLFRIDDDCVKLLPNKAKEFHNIVAKSLYATKRSRPDTCTAVAYLTTRVRHPTPTIGPNWPT